MPFCSSFPEGINVARVRRTTLTAILLLSTLPYRAQTQPKRKLFTSPEDGITFAYPANWLLNADDDAATAKLRLVDFGAPHAVVQLEGSFSGKGPYTGTDFEAGAFAYSIFDSAADACLRTLDNVATNPGKAAAITWRRLPARRLEAQFTVAGTDDLHTLIAAAEPTRCLLLEIVLIRKSVGVDIAPLPPERWAAIRSQFASILDSVRVGRPTASSALATPKPSSP